VERKEKEGRNFLKNIYRKEKKKRREESGVFGLMLFWCTF
jgi:hypothetical protein